MFLAGNIEEGAVDGRLKDDIVVLVGRTRLHDALEVLLEVLLVLLDVLAPGPHVGNQVVVVALEVEPLRLVALLQQETPLGVPLVLLACQLHWLLDLSLIEGNTGNPLVLDIHSKGHSDHECGLLFERLHYGPA